MSNKQVVSDTDITGFIRFCIELTPTLEVDPDGYVKIKEDDKKALIEVNGDEKDTKVFKPIIVYQGCIKDQNSVILNPFIEGMARNVSGEWFLDILTANASQFVRMIQKTLIIHALESKKLSELAKAAPKKKAGKKDTDTVVVDTPIQDIKLASIISRWVDKVDDITLSELDLITKKMSNYFNITYFRKSHEARVTTGIDTEDFVVAHKKVRQKSWEVFRDMLQYIFSTKDFSEYTSKANSTHCPRLDATLRLLLKLYSAMNPYMKYLPEEMKETMIHKEVDLDYLSSSIDLLDVFKVKTAHITSVAPANPNATLKSVNPVADALNHNRRGFFGNNAGGFFVNNTSNFFSRNDRSVDNSQQQNSFNSVAAFNGSPSITKPSNFGVSTTTVATNNFSVGTTSMFNGGKGWS